MKYYLAIDMGASSGRHILAHIENGKVVLEEVYRFRDYLIERDGHLCWDVKRIIEEIKAGLKKCKEVGKIPSSMGIDTWGVDFVLLDKNDNVLGDTIAYRDSRTDGMPEKVYSKLSKDELYSRTGIKEQPFNTIFQLMAIKEQTNDLESAESLLMLPCYFNYILTGVKMNEYTDASTSGLLDAQNRDWDMDIVKTMGFPEKIFTKLYMPGTKVGNFTPEIAQEVGFDCDVVLPGTHDTASAVLSVPMENGNGVYISSGTWSLMGIESKNAICTKDADMGGYSNEGGAEGSIRFLKNIMGLWIIQSIKRELKDEYSFGDLADLAREAKDFNSEFDVNDQRFLAPKSMIETIKGYLKETNQQVPETIGELMQSVYISLAKCYDESVKALEEITGEKYDSIRIVGGGCQDNYLNELTAKVTGKTVYAGPIEATALGNVGAQLLADGTVADTEAFRALIRNSFDIREV